MDRDTNKYLKYGFKSSADFWIFLVFTGVIYPLILFVFLPEFKDYDNYVAHVERSILLLTNFGFLLISGSPAAVFAEPLWFSLLALLNLLFEAQFVLGIIVGLSLTMTAVGLARINKMPWITLCLILILYPLATKYFMQFRQGFAIAIYIWAYSSSGGKAIALRLLTPMIHTSLFLLLAVEAAYTLFKQLYLSKRLLITFSSIVAVITVIAIPNLISIANAQGFISGDFKLEAPTISGTGVAIWSIYGIIFILLSRPSKEVAIGLTGVLVFVFSQFYIDIGSRLIPIFLPFFIAALSYESIKKQILIAVTILFGLVLWLPTIIDPSRVFIN